MKMRNYMRLEQLKNLAETTSNNGFKLTLPTLNKRRVVVLSTTLVLLLLGVAGFIVTNEFGKVALGDEAEIKIVSAPIAATATQKSVIAIPNGMVKTNPFLPYRDLGETTISDVPTFSLVEPPEVLNENSEAARVMDTIVSGILYDKFSPSAILNIEGNDYLVKKGDVVNNYKVLEIVKDSVTVKLGANTYKAGIGEILTEGSINHNDVSNLNNKFGGVQ